MVTPNTGRMWRARSLRYCYWDCKIVQPLWKTVWQFLTKLSIHLSYTTTIALLGIWRGEMKTYVHKRQYHLEYTQKLYPQQIQKTGGKMSRWTIIQANWSMCHGILPCNKRNPTTDTQTWITLQGIAADENADPKMLPGDSIYVTFLK